MGSQHFIDKPIVLKQCRRCNGYVFLCTDAGSTVASDTKPLTVEEYRQCIMQRRLTLDVVTQAGKPYMLRMRGVGSPWPPYAGRAVVAEHQCTKAINMAGVDLIDPPGTARVSDTSAHGVNKESAMQSLGTTRLGGRASTVTLRLSKCDSCGKPVREGELYWGIEHAGRWELLQHMECE